MQLVALDDFDDPIAALRSGKRGVRPLIAGVGEDAQDEREQRTRALIEHERRAVAILDIGGMHRGA